MMPKRADEQDTLRPVYDLDELILVAWGDGYQVRLAVGKTRVRRVKKRVTVHFKYRRKPACTVSAHDCLMTTDESVVTCRNCLRMLRE